MSKRKATGKRIAALPFRYHKKRGLEICLVTSRKRGHWIIPMGKTEKKLSHSDVAQLEAYEEAGLLGKTSNKPCTAIKTRSAKKCKKRCLILYPMKVRKTLKKWPEKHQRHRKWVPVRKLQKVLKTPELAAAIHQSVF